jgi:hypothetical protein
MEDSHPHTGEERQMIVAATTGGPDGTSLCNQQKRAMERPESIEAFFFHRWVEVDYLAWIKMY